MRITKDVVREINKYAGALSNGYVREVLTGENLGYGARIMDANSQQVWLGKPREAAAYYLGQVDVFADARGVILADYPEGVQAARAELRGGGADGPTDEWYSLGVSDGRSRVRQYCPEIRGAGKP